MNYRFLPSAYCEFELIVDHYNAERKNLGVEFIEEFFKCVESVLAFPRVCPAISAKLRKCNIKRFPYFFVYEIDRDEIIIAAVTHNKRKPGSWKKYKA